jgi:hypothetical protein
MKILTLFSIFLAIAASSFLFLIKREVMTLEKVSVRLRSDIQVAQDEIAVLNSEVYTLTTPQRIETLQKHYLGTYQQMRKEQIVSPFVASPR